jgi:hypothetical protein
MDCIDCHNRAAHKIPAPDALIDEALTAGRMDATLPYLKLEALRLMGIHDTTVSDPGTMAVQWKQPGWFEQLLEFYRTSYPEVARRNVIRAAIDNWNASRSWWSSRDGAVGSPTREPWHSMTKVSARLLRYMVGQRDHRQSASGRSGRRRVSHLP